MRFFRRKYKGASISHRRARISTETQKFNLLARYARRNLNYLNYLNYNRYTWFRLFGFLPAGQGDICRPQMSTDLHRYTEYQCISV